MFISTGVASVVMTVAALYVAAAWLWPSSRRRRKVRWADGWNQPGDSQTGRLRTVRYIESRDVTDGVQPSEALTQWQGEFMSR